MASPPPNNAPGNTQEYDSLPRWQRLSRPSEFKSWKKVLLERLRDRGLSHVPLVPPALSDRERDDRLQRRPTADELRRVTLALKFSVIARVRNEFLGGLSPLREQKPWDIWSAILGWAGQRPEDENHEASSYTSPEPARPVKPQGACFLFNKLSSLLQSIATMGLASFDNFEDYVSRFNSLRKQLLAISCDLSEKQYIVFFIMGIKDAEEHQGWIRDVKEEIETNPDITLDWVLSIANPDSRQSSAVPDKSTTSRGGVNGRENGHGSYELPSSRHHSQPYHRNEAAPREGPTYDSYKPAYDGGRGKDSKSPPSAHTDSHTQGRPPRESSIDYESAKKPYKRAQEDQWRTDRPSTSSKPSYENIKDNFTNIGFLDRVRTRGNEIDQENAPDQVRNLGTASDSNHPKAEERRVPSSAVGPTETMMSQPPMPVIGKTATPAATKVTFDDKPKSADGAGLDGKSAVPVGQNTNKTSNIQIKGSSSASTSLPNQTKPDRIDPNSKTTSSTRSRPSTMQQTLGDRPEPVDSSGPDGKSALPAGYPTNKTSNTGVRGLASPGSSFSNQRKSDSIDSNSIVTSPARSQPSTMPQHKFSAAETERSSSHSPARRSTTGPQLSNGHLNPSAPSPEKPLHGSRKPSPVTSVPSPKLPAATTGGAIKEDVLVNTRPTPSPVLANANPSRSPKDARNPMAQESESSQKPRNGAPPVSKKRELQDEPGKEPSTTGPPVKKRVSAKQLMQSMLSKRR